MILRGNKNGIIKFLMRMCFQGQLRYFKQKPIFFITESYSTRTKTYLKLINNFYLKNFFQCTIFVYFFLQLIEFQ